MESSKFATAAPNGSGAHDDGGAAALVRALRDPPPVRLERTNFGKDMRKWFLFPEGHRNLNNGSFGVAPTPVLATRARHAALSDTRPDHFQRYELPQLLLDARETAARLLNADVRDTVFVPNATTGVNVVLRNIRFNPGDRILHFGFAYPACIKGILSVCEDLHDVHPVQLEHVFGDPRTAKPASDMVRVFEEAVDDLRARGLTPRMLLLDTLTSTPGVRVPFEDLVASCRARGVMSLVDGAHGIGALEFDLPRLDPDFFVTNAHKWLHVPRSCAVMYVPRRNHHLIRTSLPTGHGFVPVEQRNAGDADGSIIFMPFETGVGEESPFALAFRYTGTIDFSPYTSLPSAVEFREKVCGGEKACRDYCANLAKEGGRRVAEMLGTCVMDDAAGSQTNGSPMATILVPLDEEAVKKDPAGVAGIGMWMGRKSAEDADTFFKTDPYDGRLWVRLSAQIFLDMEDFEWAGQMIKSLCARVKAGEHLQ